MQAIMGGRFSPRQTLVPESLGGGQHRHAALSECGILRAAVPISTGHEAQPGAAGIEFDPPVKGRLVPLMDSPTNRARFMYVVHVFQKKSKSGIRTPKADLALIDSRLKRLRELHAETAKRKKETKDG